MSFLTMSLPLSKVMGETAKIQAEYLADEAAFEDAGREPGVEMWVVVKVDKDFSLKKIDLVIPTTIPLLCLRASLIDVMRV